MTLFMSVNIFVSLDQYYLTEKFVIFGVSVVISKDKQARGAMLYFFLPIVDLVVSYIIEICL